MPFLPPGDLPNLGMEPESPVSPALSGRFTTEPFTLLKNYYGPQKSFCVLGLFLIFTLLDVKIWNIKNVINSFKNNKIYFLIAQFVRNLPAMQETPVSFLSQEDLLKKG